MILCRDGQGAVHVFLNSCRHRGMKVCRYEQGNTSLFVCPYHSWSYTTDGRLQGVPLYRALYEGTLNREEWCADRGAEARAATTAPSGRPGIRRRPTSWTTGRRASNISITWSTAATDGRVAPR